jgi:S1-C subfamily serine protease
MQRKPVLVLFLCGLVVFTLGCGLLAPSSPAAEPTQKPVEFSPTNTPAEAKPTEVKSEPTQSDGSATNLEEAQSAVIRIVAEGKYEYPDFGAVSEMGSGSGFVISPDGLAVTNNHVVTGAARIKVFFDDSEKAYNAKILGVSECSDLAVIDIDGGGFPYLSWYEDKPKLGLDVYSMGYPLGDPNFTRHAGAISKERTDGNTSWTAVSTVLEHDAIINPGNSGGPLVTEDGQVVGVNYAGASQFDQYYAIPASEAMDVIEELTNGNNVNSIGINGEAMVNDDGSFSGIWVYSVASGSPADKSGIKAGDFLIELEGISLGRDGTMTDYCDVLRTHKSSDTLGLQLVRFYTGEIMEGQLNGRELETIAVLDGSTDDPGSGGEALAFYLEEFDSDLPDWSYFFFGEDNADFELTTDSSMLTFDIDDPNTYVYLTYDPYIYTDVRLDASVLNQAGTNNNMFSLVCRVDEDLGWYEFNVTSGGLWYLFRFDESSSEWVTLWNGGSTNIKTGQNQNIFSLVCEGTKISAYINDKLMKTVTDTRIAEGQIGLSVSSFEDTPVKISFEALAITEP